MSTRVYVLIELKNGNKSEVAVALKKMPGITTLDILEGPVDLLAVIEAPVRQKAGEHLLRLLDKVDGLIEDIQVLPVQELEPAENHKKAPGHRGGLKEKEKIYQAA